MNHRNLKARKVVKALKDFGCIIKRTTDHGVIVENPRNIVLQMCQLTKIF